MGSFLVAVEANPGHTHNRQQDQPAMLDGKTDNAFKHDEPVPCQCSCAALPLPSSDLSTKLPLAA
jgi:hypothetical protein